MPVMMIVRGRQQSELPAAEFAALAARYAAVVVDLGAGDGAWAYRFARAHPETLVVALDPVAENLREYSARAAKKPDRGGQPNLLYAVASIERLPPGLRGVAAEIFITLPWGSLMRGLILAEPQVLEAVASLGCTAAPVRIVLNTRIFEDPLPLEARDLPEVTPEYAVSALTTPYAAAGLRIDEARWLEPDEVATLDTTWAKRLSHRTPPRSLLIVATVDPPPAPPGA
jgi:16S rRNA (adenine(1408)-N(1))-methyltransferase